MNNYAFFNKGMSKSLKNINSGCLILGGMPIGNNKDISLRMLEIIPEVDVVVAENVNFFLTLCNRHNLSHTKEIMKLIYDGTHIETFDKTLEHLKNNKKVLLISDCGMPTITDPGKEIVRLAIENGITVTSVPGPNVAITAISMSGFQSDKFYYYGYLPKNIEEKNKILIESKNIKCSLVLLDARTRVLDTLDLIDNVFGIETNLFVGINMTMSDEILLYGNVKYIHNELSKILKYQGIIWVVICINNNQYLLSEDPEYWTSLY
jgi:16S rRNA (cytidine1402-2'-O)-methyltransferase